MPIEIISGRDLNGHAGRKMPILVVVPYLDERRVNRAAELMLSRAGVEVTILCVKDCDGEGFVSLVNRTFSLLKADYFVYAAEDAFAGRYWLYLAVQTLEKSAKAMLAFNDGKWSGQLAAFGIVRAEWARKNYDGSLFYPAYRRHYADVELTLLARNEGVFCYNPNSVLLEVDWEKDGKPVSPEDLLIFNRRRESGFDARIVDPALLSLFG